jgi:hypothetical protein
MSATKAAKQKKQEEYWRVSVTPPHLCGMSLPISETERPWHVSKLPFYKKMTIYHYCKKQEGDLLWTEKEYKNLVSRVLSLRNDQIGALANLAGPGFSLKNINHVVEEIREGKITSANLDVILIEAKSKETLLWWIDYFEKSNNSKSQ